MSQQAALSHADPIYRSIPRVQGPSPHRKWGLTSTCHAVIGQQWSSGFVLFQPCGVLHCTGINMLSVWEGPNNWMKWTVKQEEKWHYL